MWQRDYHFTDRDTLYDCPNQAFGRQFDVYTHIELLGFLSLSKAMKNSKGVQGKEQIMIFGYILQNFGRLVTVRLSCRKDPGPFVCCEVLRPSQHY